MATVKKKPSKRLTGKKVFLSLLVRLGAALVTVVMLVGALMMVLHRDKLTLDPVRRWITYGSMSKSEDGKTEEFYLNGDTDNSYAALGADLLVCSKTAMQLYSDSGKPLVDQSVSMKSPTLSVRGNNAVAFDTGGTELYHLQGTEDVWHYDNKDQRKILTAKVNSSGYLAIMEQAGGHETTIKVLNNRHKEKIKISENNNFITDIALSENNHYIAAIQIYQDGSSFASNLVIYRLSDAHVSASYKLDDQLVLDMRWDNDRIWLQTESGVTVCDTDGTVLDGWSAVGKYLERYSLDGSGYAVELMSRYKSGSAGDLRVIDKNGQQSVSRRLHEEVLSLSAAGEYIAVLTTTSLTIYQDDLQLYATVSNTNTRRVIMREDGSVLMVGKETARLFVP